MEIQELDAIAKKVEKTFFHSQKNLFILVIGKIGVGKTRLAQGLYSRLNKQIIGMNIIDGAFNTTELKNIITVLRTQELPTINIICTQNKRIEKLIPKRQNHFLIKLRIGKKPKIKLCLSV